MTVECAGCHQLAEWSEAWTVRGLCPSCRSRQYGTAQHEQAPLCQFEPVPMAGQLAMLDTPALEIEKPAEEKLPGLLADLAAARALRKSPDQ